MVAVVADVLCRRLPLWAQALVFLVALMGCSAPESSQEGDVSNTSGRDRSRDLDASPTRDAAADTGAIADIPGSCRNGALGCACYGNGTCNAGLSCARGVCAEGPADAGLDGDLEVDVGEPENSACTRTRLLEHRTSEPANVALFFTAEDCQGRPLPMLAPEDFVVCEGGQELVGEHAAVALPEQGKHLFVQLVLNVSSPVRAHLAQVIEGAKTMVERLQASGLPVQVGVSLFAGDPVAAASLPGAIGDGDTRVLDEWQSPTLDLVGLVGCMDDIARYSTADEASANLRGAALGGLKVLD